MDEYQQLISVISLSMGVAWASGINLYAVILVLGVGGATGNIDLPESLLALQDPMVVSAAGIMYAVEFFADKTPGVDTGWDAIHTFIRIPAGAMLAASAVGDVSPALQIASGIVGGTLTGATHATKAGSRLLINTSPEPISNWVASFTEDIAVLGGLWAAINYPLAFIIALVLFIGLMIWFLPKLWRGIKKVFNKLRQWLGFRSQDSSLTISTDITGLQNMLDEGLINEDEFEQLKQNRLSETIVNYPV